MSNEWVSEFANTIKHYTVAAERANDICNKFDAAFWKRIMDNAPDKAHWKDIHYRAQAFVELEDLVPEMCTAKSIVNLLQRLASWYYALARDTEQLERLTKKSLEERRKMSEDISKDIEQLEERLTGKKAEEFPDSEE